MNLKKTNFIGKLHCPECNSMYIIMDNEIMFCPGCELSSKVDTMIFNEEECQEKSSSIANLNYNKSSCS